MNTRIPLTPPPATRGPWRYVLLDRDPADPGWVIVTVQSADDVAPATLDAAGRHTDWALTIAWPETRTGNPVQLQPVHDALVWLVEPERPRFAVLHGAVDE